MENNINSNKKVDCNPFLNSIEYPTDRNLIIQDKFSEVLTKITKS